VSDREPAVVIIARRPEVAGEAGRLLLRRALGWARAVAPDRVHVAGSPAEQEALAEVVDADVTHLPLAGDGLRDAVAGACAHVFAGGERPLLIVWPSLPRLPAAHAQAALEDLRHGCDVVIGPVFDGGLYLVAVRALPEALLALPAECWQGPQLLAAAGEAELAVGLLRPERGLRRPPDIRAALADPLLDAELAAVLRDGACA
jgi:glycosyltransferase A (GT-A) superfamily protein (DUF2064 family)